MSRHHTTIYLEEFLGAEYAACVEYTYTRGRPATGPTWDSGGDPAEDPEAEIQSFTLHKIIKPTADRGGELTFTGRGNIRYTLSSPLECPEWLEDTITAFILAERFDKLEEDAEDEFPRRRRAR